MKKAEMVSFCFENCESVDIPVRWFHRFRISGIHEEIEKRLGKITYADFCEMELYWDIEKEVHRFDGIAVGGEGSYTQLALSGAVQLLSSDIVSFCKSMQKGSKKRIICHGHHLISQKPAMRSKRHFIPGTGNLRIRIKKRSEV